MNKLINDGDFLAEIRDRINMAAQPFDSREAFEATAIPASIKSVSVTVSGGIVQLLASDTGDWISKGGRRWRVVAGDLTNSQVSDFLAAANRNGIRVFANRAAAIDEGQEGIPFGVGTIITQEGAAIVWREPEASGDDPLFSTSPYWGVSQRVDQQADAERTAAALGGMGIITLSNMRGNANALVGDLPENVQAAGVTFAAHSKAAFTPASTNTGPASLTVGGFTAPIVTSAGAALSGGELAGGQPVIVMGDGEAFRVFSSGAGSDGALAEIQAELAAISAPGPADGGEDVIVLDGAGSFLRALPDGADMIPSHTLSDRVFDRGSVVIPGAETEFSLFTLNDLPLIVVRVDGVDFQPSASLIARLRAALGL